MLFGGPEGKVSESRFTLAIPVLASRLDPFPLSELPQVEIQVEQSSTSTATDKRFALQTDPRGTATTSHVSHSI